MGRDGTTVRRAPAMSSMTPNIALTMPMTSCHIMQSRTPGNARVGHTSWETMGHVSERGRGLWRLEARRRGGQGAPCGPCLQPTLRHSDTPSVPPAQTKVKRAPPQPLWHRHFMALAAPLALAGASYRLDRTGVSARRDITQNDAAKHLSRGGGGQSKIILSSY